jgi:flagellar export protein FliJ
MSKFQFRLATLLRLREAAREERQIALADAYRADGVLEQRQQQLADELAGLKGDCRQASAPGQVNVDRLVESQRYELLLRAATSQLGQQREQLGIEIQRRREAVVQANRAVRVLEKLRERQLERHRADEAYREMRLLDEVAGRMTAEEEAV